MVIPFMIYFLLEDLVKYLKKRFFTKPRTAAAEKKNAREYLRSA